MDWVRYTKRPAARRPSGERWRRRILLLATGLLLAGFATELAARAAWHWQYNRFLEGWLIGLQEIDRQKGILILKPGLSLTYRELGETLRRHGETEELELLQSDADRAGLHPDDVAFRTNRFGFLGPEIDKEKPVGTVRALMIGDSVTFGPYVERLSYPRVLERELSASRKGDGERVEVVNAGVQGYNLESVLMRLDYFLDFKPDIITVLIG